MFIRPLLSESRTLFSSYGMVPRLFTRSLYRPNKILFSKNEPLDIAVCIDIECTCDSPVQITPMEVIEIACLKLDLKSSNKSRPPPHDIVKGNDTYPSFQSFVRPEINKELTTFCQELTGIMQSEIDKAPTKHEVSRNLMNWLRENDLIDNNFNKKANFAFASCGNFDIKILSPVIKDCHFNDELELPIYFKEWINVKKTFFNHRREWPKGLYHMMELLNIEPFGRLHSAIDDCKNLAGIVECLHLEGCKFHITNKA